MAKKKKAINASPYAISLLSKHPPKQPRKPVTLRPDDIPGFQKDPREGIGISHERRAAVNGYEQFVQFFEKQSMTVAMKAAFRKEHVPLNEQEVEALEDQLVAIAHRSGLFTYKPHKKQRAFHEARCQTKLFLGSNQSGKTTALIAEALSWAIGWCPWKRTPITHPNGSLVVPPVRIALCGEDFTTAIAGNILLKMKDLIPFDVLVVKEDKSGSTVTQQLEFFNGSIIKFMSYRADPSVWEGPTWHWVGFDEPPPRHCFVSTVRGCMKYEAPICFSMTPLKEPWIYEELYQNEKATHFPEKAKERDAIFVINVDLDDNPFLKPEQKKRLAESVNQEEAEARIHGRFMHLMGRVYKTYDEEIHVGDFSWNKNWPAGVVVDPHDRRPYAIAWFVVSPLGELIWVHEWPDFDFLSTRSWDWGLSEYCDQFHGVVERLQLNMAWWIMDPRFGGTIKATSGTTLIEEFEASGIYFDRDFWADDIAAGRGLVHDALSSNKMLWLPHLKNFRAAMRNHTWDDWTGRGHDTKAAKDRERSQYKDFCDLARYACEARPLFFEKGEWNQNALKMKRPMGM